ncbi:hypothetical protein Tco_1472057 [Tanacetum coccineum]
MMTCTIGLLLTDPPKEDVLKSSKKEAECSKLKEKDDATRHIAANPKTEPQCSSTSELECSSTSELEFPSSDEVSSYLSTSNEYDSFDESGSLVKSVSQKGPSKDLLKWYEDDKDEENAEIDEEAEDGKDDSDDELWSPKSIETSTKSTPKMKGTSSKSTPTPKIKGTSSKSTPTTNKQVAK